MERIMKPYFSHLPCFSKETQDRILFGIGLILLLGELYKQLFLYYCINNGAYDWWYFPFQLCSLPMYLCLIQYVLPDSPLKTDIFTFMQDFHLLGGIAALTVPDGFSGIHWSLTLHGYVWHVLLIAISLLLFFGKRTDCSRRGFLRTLPTFAVCCCIALIINVSAPGDGIIDMFYISPYHPSTQPVFHELSLLIGILPGNLLYLASVMIGAGCIHLLYHLLAKRIFPK